MNEALRSTQRARIAYPRRAELSDFIYLYEPTECFTVSATKVARDCASVRHGREQAFVYYIGRRKVPVAPIDRGGGIMWHGPGQVILAPLVDIRRARMGVYEYSALLEETCIRTLQRLGVTEATSNRCCSGAQGAWVEHRGVMKKLAFFGWKESGGIAIHGCAINISPDLSPFTLIDTCNIPGVQVTSIQQVLGHAASLEEATDVLEQTFGELLEKQKARA